MIGRARPPIITSQQEFHHVRFLCCTEKKRHHPQVRALTVQKPSCYLGPACRGGTGSGAGDPQELQFRPIRKLAKIYNSYGIRASFNAEVGFGAFDQTVVLQF